VANLAQERGAKKVMHARNFFIPYMICKRTKCVYTQVAEGQITYRVYAICSGANYVCLWVASW
jgi:hypothetical protein